MDMETIAPGQEPQGEPVRVGRLTFWSPTTRSPAAEGTGKDRLARPSNQTLAGSRKKEKDVDS